ncbi:MAG: DUF202 domain-containing protein [Polyangiales bacterium]
MNELSRISATDALAAERTALAAERTMLAYMRTAFAMFATGLTGAEFLKDRVLVAIAYLFVALSLLVFVVGGWRFQQSRKKTEKLVATMKTDA